MKNPYREEREKSKGELEVETGSLLLMLYRALGVPMPKDTDPACVERSGQLLGRRFPGLGKIKKWIEKIKKLF